MTIVSGSGRRMVTRRKFDGWRWSGRIFLVFLLIFSIMPRIAGVSSFSMVSYNRLKPRALTVAFWRTV